MELGRLDAGIGGELLEGFRRGEAASENDNQRLRAQAGAQLLAGMARDLRRIADGLFGR